MKDHPIIGKTLKFTFIDGPMANKTMEHVFDEGGGVTWREAGKGGGGTDEPTKYEVGCVGDDVYGVSYLAKSGFTLTCLLDFRNGRLVSFASNEKGMSLANGTFTVVGEERPDWDAANAVVEAPLDAPPLTSSAAKGKNGATTHAR